MEKVSIWGTVCGGSIGVWKSLNFLLQINPSFSVRLFQAVFIAAACAIAGGFGTSFGKWLWTRIKDWLFKPKSPSNPS